MPPLPPSGPGSKSRRRWFLGVSAVLTALILIWFRDVLLPFVLALVLAYVLSPIVEFGQQIRVAGRTPPRWLVVLALYIALIGVLSGLVGFAVPRLVAELQRLTREGPSAVETVRKVWLPELDRRLRDTTARYLPPKPAGVAAEDKQPTAEPAVLVRPGAKGSYEIVLPPGGVRVVPEGERAFRVEVGQPRRKGRADISAAITEAVGRSMENTEHTVLSLLAAAQRFLGSLARGVFGFVMMLVVSAYLLITANRIFEFVRSLYVPQKRPDFDDLVRRIDRGLSGVVRGQLIICAINGVLSGIGFYAFGLKYWAFLTLFAGVMSIVPIFGSILSTIPAVLVALPQGGLPLALLVLAWIVAIHQLEANVLNPKIMGDSAKVHPVLVIFALLAGEHVAGFVGALLAVPVLSITQTLFLYLRERFLGVPRNSSTPPPVPLEPPAQETVATADVRS
jgi:predicted PurR-regulated permease PerM